MYYNSQKNSVYRLHLVVQKKLVTPCVYTFKSLSSFFLHSFLLFIGIISSLSPSPVSFPTNIPGHYPLITIIAPWLLLQLLWSLSELIRIFLANNVCAIMMQPERFQILPSLLSLSTLPTSIQSSVSYHTNIPGSYICRWKLSLSLALVLFQISIPLVTVKSDSF